MPSKETVNPQLYKEPPPKALHLRWVHLLDFRKWRLRTLANFTDKGLVTLAPVLQASRVSWISMKFPFYHFSVMVSYIERQFQIFLMFWPNHFHFIFTYFWLCWIFIAVYGLSLVVVSKGYSLLQSMSFSLLWLLLLAQLLTELVSTFKMAPIRTIDYMAISYLIDLLWKSVSQGFSMNTENCLYPGHLRFEDILDTTSN